jgi:Integrase core domain
MAVRQMSRHELAMALQTRYRKARRLEKSRILDEFCAATGYHRKYAIDVLGHGPPRKRPRLHRVGRPATYGREVVRALQVVAESTGWICGKRLAAALCDVIPALEREGALTVLPAVRQSLLRLSAATIDRRLAPARQRAKPRGLMTTKPGSLLKKQIPIRTYTPWDDQRAGFVEIDLVAHCGTSAAGEYVCTLVMTDVATGWTECAAVPNKGQRAVLAAVRELAERLPMALLGIDSDNGSEFLNAHLLGYCREHGITFTRCRAYHKNDQAHVEQKNWSVVRHVVGYDRYQGVASCEELNRIYLPLHPYLNGYLPTMKLIGKERKGSQVRKRYDTPQTPYHRVLAAGVALPERQNEFDHLLHESGPMTLRRQIDAALERLWVLRVDSEKAVAAAATA